MKLNKLVASVLTGLALWAPAQALPTGPSVVHGQVQIQTQNGTMQVLQGSNQAIVNWNGFNINTNELVQFLQQNRQAIILNRVTGVDPSVILGAMRANGQVILVNPNGILFGPNSIVDVGSFMASTLKISDEDFLAGRYRFQQDPNQALTSIVNQGRIEVTQGGYLVLTSPLIHNEGLIIAQQGQVALAAGKEATVSFDGQGLLQVALAQGFPQLGSQVQPGTVLLTSAQMSNTLTQVVTHPNLLEAGELVQNGSHVELRGGEGVLVNSGTIRADGGSVKLNSTQATVLPSSGTITANGLGPNSKGGNIDVLSAGKAVVAGRIEARGGQGGQGGRVDVSAATPILVSAPDVSAPGGTAGLILLDPTNINIEGTGNDLSGFLPSIDAADGGANPGFVTIAALQSITSGTILLEATNNINWTQGGDTLVLHDGVSLVLHAGNGIFFNSTKSVIGVGGDFTARADSGNIQMGAVQMSSSGGVGGNVTLEAPNGRITLAGDLTGRIVNLRANGDIFTDNFLLSFNEGGNIRAANLLGDSSNDLHVNVALGGPLNLTLTGAPPTFANGVSSHLHGTIGDNSISSSGLNIVSTTSSTGRILFNDVQAYPSSSSGGESSGGGSYYDDNSVKHYHDVHLVDIEELRQSLLRDSSQANFDLGNLETYSPEVARDFRLFSRRYRSASSQSMAFFSATLETIYDRELENVFWRDFIARFIIWEDDAP